MTNSENQNPAPVLRAVRPPVTQRSAFAARVSSDLEKVFEHKDPKTRAKEITLLTQLFEEKPLLGLSYWLTSVPKKKFAKVGHLNRWIDLLCSLIERYASIHNRKQTKGVSWKSDCLRGMLRELSRTPHKCLDGSSDWKDFTDSLIAEARPRTRNPVTKAFFKKGNTEAENFRKLGMFIQGGTDVWEGDYEFPLKLLQHLNSASLSSSLTTGSVHEKTVGIFAMRMDFLRQQQKHSAGLKVQLPSWAALKYLVMRLGDFELAKIADEALTPFQPVEDSLVAELEAAVKSNKSRQRRPNAKPRKPR
jgi:hypothetical protein